MAVGLPTEIANLNIDNCSSSNDATRGNAFADVIRRNHRARDVTQELRKATQALKIGQLVKNDTFTLFESVQALEIMDPKMDSGCLAPGDSFDDDYDILTPLQPEQVLGIIDQMLSYEMAWYQGYPLSQTLFTSLYLDHVLSQKERPTGTLPLFLPSSEEERDSQPLLHLVLRAYCIGVIKTCDITVEMIASQLYYEEEDFCTQTYGRDLLTDVSDADCLALLDEAICCVNTKSKFGSGLAHALKVRLASRRRFVEAFIPAPGRPSPKWEFGECTKYLVDIKATHSLAAMTPEAFSPKVHRRLASTAPPRPAVELAFDETWAKLGALYEDLLRVLDILAYDGGSFGLRTFLWIFASRVPQPSTFARAFLQSMTVGQGQIASPDEAGGLLEDDLRLAIKNGQDALNPTHWAVEHPEDVRFQIARAIEQFYQLAGPEYTKMCQSLCQNRCRMRRCLTNTLESLDIVLGNLKDAANPALHDRRRDPSGLLLETRQAFVQCVQTLMYQIMAWILQLGFEQDIMQPHELAFGYNLLWYFLQEIDCGYTEPAESEDYLKDPGDWTPQESARLMLAWERSAVLNPRDGFAQALAMLYSLCYRLGLLHGQPLTPLSTAESQRKLRMRPFLMLQNSDPIPEYIWHNVPTEDKTVDEMLGDIESDLEEAKNGFKELRTNFTPKTIGCLRSERPWVEDITRIEKSCVRAKLVLLSIRRALDKHGADRLREHAAASIPAAERRDHGWWIVPEVTIKD